MKLLKGSKHYLKQYIIAKSQTKSATGSKHTTKIVTKAGKADKRTKLGGAKK